MARGNRKKTVGAISCNWSSSLMVISAALTFFCGGILIGSKIAHPNDSNGLASSGNLRVGLPGTYNIFKKWAQEEGDDDDNASPTGPDKIAANLRGAAAVEYRANSEESSARVDNNVQRSVDLAPYQSDQTSSAGANENILKRSLHATGGSFMTVSHGDVLDNGNILVGAYIYLDDTPARDHDMRPVFANKSPGCENTADQYGFALTVNGWQDGDHRVHLEYGGAHSGCYKLDSKDVLLVPKKWYHLAVYAGPSDISLYVDGVLVDSTSEDSFHAHMVQTRNPWTVGTYGNGEYFFYGNISHLTILHDLSPGTIERTLDRIRILDENAHTMLQVPELFALYPMMDASSEVDNGRSADTRGEHHGVYTFPVWAKASLLGVKIDLVDGTTGRGPITDEMRKESDRIGLERRERIKEGMLHAWAGYKKFAWGKDELKPISQRGTDNWGGMGVTLVDSLDTLWIMGLKNEFAEARDWVASSLTYDHAGSVSVFETTIRELGGLIAAHDLSQDEVFLRKAKELGDRLLPAFKTKTGIPTGQVNLRTGTSGGGWSAGSAILSELGSLQLENRYLSQYTKDDKYEAASMVPMQRMSHLKPESGLYPIKIGIESGNFADSQVTFGALGDSFYEYMLKIWIQGGKKETWLREMYDKAVDGMIDKLLMASHKTGIAFLGDWNLKSNRHVRKMDHLVCFMPGVLALGSVTDPQGKDSSRAKRDMAVAKALTYTCREMYHRQKTGIAPEYVEFPDNSKDMVPAAGAPFYILRPETAESLFILNQLTGDPIYREWAWEIWEAIEKHCKTKNGYGAIPNVNMLGKPEDRMESFFLAETIKYLYLAQDPDMPIDLMKYVFNTEAHPTRVFDDSHSPVGE